MSLRFLALFVLIDNPLFKFARGDVDEPHEERDFVLLVETAPNKADELVDCAFYLHAHWFALECHRHARTDESMTSWLSVLRTYRFLHESKLGSFYIICAAP